MKNKLIEISVKTRELSPLVHCITGEVSANICANGVLALGARPICAQHPREVEEITSSCDALLINFSGITSEKLKAIRISLNAAKKMDIPVVLDVVGIACSRYRKSIAKRIIKKYKPDVVKGNYSEIYALFDDSFTSSGVDDGGKVEEREIILVAKTLSERYKTIILASGKTDVVYSGSSYYLIKNGTPYLTTVTGTGCLLGAITATFLASDRSAYSAVSACARLGIAGEKAEGDCFSVRFIENLSKPSFSEDFKIEEVCL